jgi:hypothetical protein
MTLVVFAEKVLRHGLRISVVVALGLIALGLLRPSSVPADAQRV